MAEEFDEFDQVVEQQQENDFYEDAQDEQQDIAQNLDEATKGGDDQYDDFVNQQVEETETYGDNAEFEQPEEEEEMHNTPAPPVPASNFHTYDTQEDDEDDWDQQDEQAEPLDYESTADRVAHALENRPSESQLENSGIQRSKRGSMSDLLAGTAVELEKQMTADRVSHAFETRPSEAHLEDVGIIRGKSSGNMSNALAGTAVQLEKEMKADVISQTIAKRGSDLGHTPLGGKRTSLSNMLAASAKELEKNMIVDNVSIGLNKRASKQDLLDRGVLKRPPSESHMLAAKAVTLEKALNTDRVSEGIARTIRAYADVSAMDKAAAKSGDSDIASNVSMRDRMDAYLKAVREANPSPKSPTVGAGIRDRLRAYQDATKSPASFKGDADAESKTVETPLSSLQERMSMYQEAATSKISPKSFALEGINLKERLEKSVDIEALAEESVDDEGYDEPPAANFEQAAETIEVDKMDDDDFN